MSKAKKVQPSSQQRTLWQETWRRFKKNKLAVAGMIFLMALVVIAIATIIIDAVNPSIYETYVIKQNLRERLAPPSAAHIFGQDEFGRDMLMRILWAIRSSLFMGALSIALSCIVGGLLGAIAGYYGGKLDNVIMRIMDVFSGNSFHAAGYRHRSGFRNQSGERAAGHRYFLCADFCQNRPRADSHR